MRAIELIWHLTLGRLAIYRVVRPSSKPLQLPSTKLNHHYMAVQAHVELTNEML
jgi:hypothetical protein